MENHYSVMNRLMHRFRPIAPKPAASENLSVAEEQDRRNGAVKFGRRTKRKYVRVRGRQTTKRKPTEEERSSPPEKSGVDDAPPPERSERSEATLQLLPMVRSESEKSFCYSSSSPKFQDIIIDLDRDRLGEVSYKSDGGVTAEAAATWIVVESVTDQYAYGGVLGLGFSDGEIVKNLQADTCPGFVSDGANNVVWVNDAYRRMAAAAAAESEVLVRLVVRKQLPYFTPSFACRVRMVQQMKHGQKWNRIVACDVWRMGFAGFAWKLDVQTAIGL